MIIVSSSVSSVKSLYTGTQWFAGCEARASEEKNEPMSASYGWSARFIRFKVTALPSEIRVASMTWPN